MSLCFIKIYAVLVEYDECSIYTKTEKSLMF